MSNCCHDDEVTDESGRRPGADDGRGRITIAPLRKAITIALIGNPNAGKTTLFNALTGLRARTANFPGTTIERKLGRLVIGEVNVMLMDLPGLYSLDSGAPEEKVAGDALRGRLAEQRAPDAVMVVVDATNLERNLFLVSQVLELNKPVIVALTMMDVAARDGLRIDVAALRKELGCAVTAVSGRDGTGIEELKAEIVRLIPSGPMAAGHPARASAFPGCAGCSGCAFQARYEWTEKISTRVLDARA
ncbi:MAG: 50S ribosome-binding GTPase, partial [Verrucomicrobia bacterium]|nr:50S ribosome-binding GTPase [Verrucomicrobiota bacterium]